MPGWTGPCSCSQAPLLWRAGWRAASRPLFTACGLPGAGAPRRRPAHRRYAQDRQRPQHARGRAGRRRVGSPGVGGAAHAQPLQRAPGRSWVSTRQAVLLSIELPPALSREEGHAYYESLVTAVGAVPGVERASLARVVPVAGGSRRLFRVPGYVPRSGEDMELHVNTVHRNYFETMGFAPIEGRLFQPSDAGRIPIIVVNDILADRYFGGHAVGRRMQSGKTVFEIVGVVRAQRRSGLQDPPDAGRVLPTRVGLHPDRHPGGEDVGVRARSHRNNPAYCGRGQRGCGHFPGNHARSAPCRGGHRQSSDRGPRRHLRRHGVRAGGSRRLRHRRLCRRPPDARDWRARRARRPPRAGGWPAGARERTGHRGGRCAGRDRRARVHASARSMLYGVSATDPATFFAVPSR